MNESVCDKYCNGCIYQKKFWCQLMYCAYLFQTGKRRPCKAGTGCTVKTSVKQRKPKQPKVHGTKKICEYCGMEFTLHNNNTQKYCSSKCRYAAHYENGKNEKKEKEHGQIERAGYEGAESRDVIRKVESNAADCEN